MSNLGSSEVEPPRGGLSSSGPIPPSEHYYPSSHIMFKWLGGIHEVLAGSDAINKLFPAYNTVLSRAYYSVIWFIQVLRAKSAARALTRKETQFLERFGSAFLWEYLPIAGPLKPYFMSLGAIKPNDKSAWAYPSLPIQLGPSLACDLSLSSQSPHHHALLPCFPGIISLFHAIKDHTGLALYNDEIFVPSEADTGDWTFQGHTFSPPATRPWSERSYFWLPGINKAPEQSVSDLALTQSSLRRYSNIPVVTPGTRLATIDEYLLMTEDMSWFQHLITNAFFESTLFKDSTTLSKIPPVARLQTITHGAFPIFDLRDIPEDVPSDWYPRAWIPLRTQLQPICTVVTDIDCPIGINTMISMSLPPDLSRYGGAGLSDRRFGHSGNDVDDVEREEDLVPRPLYSPLIKSAILTHYYKVKDEASS